MHPQPVTTKRFLFQRIYEKENPNINLSIHKDMLLYSSVSSYMKPVNIMAIIYVVLLGHLTSLDA